MNYYDSCLCRSLPVSKPFHNTLLVFFFSVYFSLSSLLQFTSALVHFRGNSFSVTFIDAPARFAVPVYGSGICGALHLADPIDACSSLRNTTTTTPSTSIRGGQAGPVRFVLIARGTCSFERKVRNAQDAGFKAAIVYDDQEKGSLISMIGNSEGIWTHALFVSKMAGETLKKFAQGEEGECCIGSSTEETAGTVLVISFVSLVVIVSVLATFFFARNCRLFRHGAHNHPPSINRQEVEVLPCFTFNSAFPNHKCASESCAICLEDYRDGETLRVLPCRHDFHSVCVDLWLTKWGTFCPVCKHEMSSGQ